MMNSKDYHRTWYYTTTLLGCDKDHDINRRQLYRGGIRMHVFNDDMNVWSVWKDEAIQRACDELNKIEEADAQGL